MENDHNLIISVLKDSFIMTLATVSDNNPYACTVMYATNDGINIYFVSHIGGDHIINISKNNKIAANLYNQGSLESYEKEKIGVQLIGSAKAVMDKDECISALKMYGERFVGAKNWYKDVDECLSPSSTWHVFKIVVNKAKFFNSVLGIKDRMYVDLAPPLD